MTSGTPLLISEIASATAKQLDDLWLWILETTNIIEADVDLSDKGQEYSLILSIQRGEQSNFQVIVERYQHKIVGLIARQVRDQSTAEDLAQEVFVRAYRGLSGFKGESRFSTWLTRIALNVTSSYFVSRKFKERKRSEQFDSVKHDRPQNIESSYDQVADEMREALRAAVAELKPTYREVLILCAFEGKQYEEAAEILSIPVGTVRSRLNKARHMLRAELGIMKGVEQ